MKPAQSENLGQLLFRCARLLNEQAMARMEGLGTPGLRPNHLRLLEQLDPEGTRSTELARRLKISKQAVGQLVVELQRQGLLQRIPDPCDKRAWRVTRTELGQRSLGTGLSVMDALHLEAEGSLGPERMQRLLEDLDSLRQWLAGNFSSTSR